MSTDALPEEWEIIRTGRRYGIRAGLSVSRDHGLSTSLATNIADADIETLNAGNLPASVRSLVRAHSVDSQTFGSGIFFPTIGRVKIVTESYRWIVEYRYSVQIHQGRGEAPGVLIGPEEFSFRAPIPEDYVEDFFGAWCSSSDDKYAFNPDKDQQIIFQIP